MSKFELEHVLPLGVLTGSRAFNVATKESDWDIVIVESLVPSYYWADDYQSYEFCPGESIPEHTPELDNAIRDPYEENALEYDCITIWGPITKIIKYWYLEDEDDESTKVCINLFVYPDSFKYLYDKFIELNNRMKFIYGPKLRDRELRVEAFTNIIADVGITDAI